jgi:hypothetical protein
MKSASLYAGPRSSKRMRGRSRHTAADVTLFDALYAFFLEHRHCGELDGGVEGDRFWLACSCGASINRDADPE